MIVEFENCVLDASRRVLLRGGEPQPMEPQVFDLLSYLVQNPGRAVSKAELIDAIWEGRVVSDSAVTSRIKAVRRSVGDNGVEQRIIRTVHRVGYRFEADIRAPDSPEPVMAKTSFFRDRSGRNIAYTVAGSGPLVICPAWWVSNVRDDAKNPDYREFFNSLGSGLTMVRYDRPGTGMSDRSLMTRTVDDEVALLEDVIAHLGAQEFSFFAMSSGAPTAIVYADRYPERVRSICFYGSYVRGADLCPPEVQDVVVGTIRAHWGLGARAIADMFLPDASPTVRQEFARHQRHVADADAAATLMRLTYAMDATAELGRISLPATVIHREDDRCVPLAQARELAAGLPGASLQVLAGSAHPPWFEGENISRIANEFLVASMLAATVPENANSAPDIPTSKN